jgi:hypothetical protein
MKSYLPYIIILLLIGLLVIECQKDKPKVIVKTNTKVEKVTDTLVKTIIKEVPKTVYVERTKTIKGKDSIIYVDKPTDTSIEANQYDTTLKANEATADLQITTTGTLLDVQGTINYPKETITTTITEKRDKSGLYGFISSPVNGVSPEVGALYQIKNKMFISTSVQYNDFTNKIDLKAGIGIKLF